ncbi:MAG: bifunctional transcriptional activator/DNA repair enzyme protein Ada [Waddliaceae bacterium]|nr:bifunctional transcriptional activator/DNA repair enzyme protein Ada [Waddliaceae bacterium]
MICDEEKEEFYQALIRKNSLYEGVFFVAVTSTGIFCRPTCPARKPKIQNCEFYKTAQEALIAGFRPCKRCRPLSPPNEVSDLIVKLVAAVEKEPEKRWTDKDFRELSVDASTARRQFKKRFGMTFVEYARARRMGIAMKQVKSGESLIQAQLSVGYESSSGFRDAFSKIMGKAPNKSKETRVFNAAWIDTELGPMIAIADDQQLYLLEFVDRRGLEREIERLRQKMGAAIVPGETEAIQSIKKELCLYFQGKLSTFSTPLALLGSDFQKTVWKSLMEIPPGETRSYTELAQAIGKPSACRAVARANGANQIAIVIPCHRVINSNGELGGYGGGLGRKKYLIDHEKNLP